MFSFYDSVTLVVFFFLLQLSISIIIIIRVSAISIIKKIHKMNDNEKMNSFVLTSVSVHLLFYIIIMYTDLY